MLTEGSVLEDRYRIEKKTGEGGSSIVYKAVHLRTGRWLAVKEIQGSFSGESIEESIQLLKKLRHPGLPLVLDVIRAEQQILIIMEYMEGETLQKLLEERKERGQKFSPEEALKIGREICEILAYLHTEPEPLLYRDLKPDNILIQPDGSAALVDLGTVCLLQHGEFRQTVSSGTPGYAAPEQYRQREGQGPSADLYSLGAVLHQLLTGINPADHPFSFKNITGENPDLIRYVRGRDRLLVMGLEKILERCTSFRPEDRYQTAEELLRDLNDPLCILDSGKSQVRCLAAVFLLLSGLFFFSFSLWSEQRTETYRAEGKAFYMMKARRSEPAEAFIWTEYALEVSPGDAECFSVLLDRMLQDGIFSQDEQLQMRALLNQTAEGESMDHETLLEQNPESCLRFACRMGTVCLYAADGIPDYSAAADWFREALSCGGNWNPAEEQDAEEKEFLTKRAEALLKICSCREQILLYGQPGESEESLLACWRNLTALIGEDIPENSLLETDLEVKREILGLLTDWPSELHTAGVTWKEQRIVTESVKTFSEELLNSSETERYPARETLLEELIRTADAAEKKRLLLEEAAGETKRKEADSDGT